MKFEWHGTKAAANLRKHGVSFDEAATVFGDTLSHVFPDADHSDDESRFLLVGMSENGRVLVVSPYRPGSENADYFGAGSDTKGAHVL